jgi:hypothetical protein
MFLAKLALGLDPRGGVGAERARRDRLKQRAGKRVIN